MADPPTKPRTWVRPSGTYMGDCPRCVDAGELTVSVVGRYGNTECPLCKGKGEVGLAALTTYILQHAKTDPPADPADLAESDPDADTKPER
jgi:hypothetical protein